MVDFSPATFSILCAVVVLTFFIAGLLYLSRFERVDNLGAYSIPSETGLLIPSVYMRLVTPLLFSSQTFVKSLEVSVTAKGFCYILAQCFDAFLKT